MTVSSVARNSLSLIGAIASRVILTDVEPGECAEGCDPGFGGIGDHHLLDGDQVAQKRIADTRRNRRVGPS